MAGPTLAIAGGAILGPGGAIVGGMAGAMIDQALIMPLLADSEIPPPKAGDLLVSMANEGAKSAFVWGSSARIPVHLTWTSNAWEVSTPGSMGGKREDPAPPTSTWYQHGQLTVAHGAVTPLRLMADAKRVWTSESDYVLQTTTGTWPVDTNPRVVITKRSVLRAGGSWFGQLWTVHNTRDALGDPITGAPDLSVFDVGGVVAMKIEGYYANGTGTATAADEWPVVASRADANGNTELVLSRPGFGTPIPAAWSSYFTLVAGTSYTYRANAGLTAHLYHDRVSPDPKVFPVGAAAVAGTGGVEWIYPDASGGGGTTHSDLLDALLGSSEESYQRDTARVVLEQVNLSGFGNRWPNWEAVVGGHSSFTVLGTALEDIRDRFTELDATEASSALLDATDLSGVRAFTPLEPLGLLTKLAIGYDIYWQEGYRSGYWGYWQHAADRSIQSVSPINARSPGSAFDDDAIDFQRIDATERPKVVKVDYTDQDNDWQKASASWVAQAASDGEEVTVELSDLTMTAARAKSIAERVGRRAWSRIRAAKFRAAWTECYIQEEDIVRVVDDDGVSWSVLVDKVDISDDLFVSVHGYAVDEAAVTETESLAAEALSEDGIGGGLPYAYDTGEPVAAAGYTPLLADALDIRPIRQADVGKVGFYAAAAPGDRSKRFLGAAVFVQRASSTCWDVRGHITSRCTGGYAIDTLASGTGYDTTNDVDVKFLSGTPATTTSTLCDDTRNLYAIGAEVCGVVTVAGGTDDEYTLSNIYRGLSETEGAVGGHAEGDVVWLLDDSVVFIPLPVEDIGTTISVKIVPAGASADDIDELTLAVTGETLTPVAPVDLALSLSGSDLLAEWTYRSIHSIRYRTPADSPRGDGERYVAKFWNSTAAAISGDPDYEVDVDILEDDLTVVDPGGKGLTGPDIACRLLVRSNQWGDSDYDEDEFSQTYVPVAPVYDAFTDLNDTPSSYSGEAGKFPRVNAGEDALEFHDVTGTVQTSSSTPVTVAVTDRLVLVDATAAAATVNLPAAANCDRPVTIKKTDSSSNTVTIDGDGAETIDGDTTRVLSTQWATVTLDTDGSNWSIR